MQDIKLTILEYKLSRNAVQRRIHELNGLIGSTPCRENSTVRELLSRRWVLYTELWDIEYALKSLGEYAATSRGHGEVKRNIV